MKKWKKSIMAVSLWALVMAFGFVGVVACGDGDDDDSKDTDTGTGTESDTGTGTESDTGTGTESDTTEDMAYVRVVHLSPDAPAVDVFANDGATAVISNLAFESSSDYLEVAAGTYTFDVAPTGMTEADAVLTLENVELMAGDYYTAYAYGALANINGAAVMDDWDGLGASDIRIRAIHAADGVGQVDIWNVTPGTTPAALYENVDYEGAGAYQDIPAGQYNLGLDADDDGQPEFIYALPELPAGTVVTAFAVLDGAAPSLIAQLDADNTARIDQGSADIRVIHLSPDAPAVDVFANMGASAAFSNLAFEETTSFATLGSAGYDFQVAPTGTTAGDSVLDLDGLLLQPGASYTAVAFNALASIQGLALEENLTVPAAGSIRVRAIHIAAGVGQVDIWNVTGTPSVLYENVDFAAVGDFAELPAGTYSLGIDTDNDMNPDLTFDLPNLAAGTIANIFAVNNAGVYLVVQFSDNTVAIINPTT